MERHYTENLILKYLFRETSLTQTLEVEHSIEYDAETREIYKKLRDNLKKLPKVLFYPKDETVANILNYSSATSALDFQC